MWVRFVPRKWIAVETSLTVFIAPQADEVAQLYTVMHGTSTDSWKSES